MRPKHLFLKLAMSLFSLVGNTRRLMAEKVVEVPIPSGTKNVISAMTAIVTILTILTGSGRGSDLMETRTNSILNSRCVSAVI